MGGERVDSRAGEVVALGQGAHDHRWPVVGVLLADVAGDGPVVVLRVRVSSVDAVRVALDAFPAQARALKP
jgi:hypothetical protein